MEAHRKKWEKDRDENWNKQVKDNIKDIVNKRNERCNKSSYKPTKEDLSKLRKEDLINMIINEEEPKKNQN